MAVNFKRVILCLLGILCSFILIELSLRFGGLIYKYSKYLKSGSRPGKNEIVILCIGESTTAGQWPPFLQSMLKKKLQDKDFRVIDMGLAAVNSGRLLSELEKYFESGGRADILISMMGVNDFSAAIYLPLSSSDEIFVFRRLRLYKLFKVLSFLFKETKKKKADMLGEKNTLDRESEFPVTQEQAASEKIHEIKELIRMNKSSEAERKLEKLLSEASYAYSALLHIGRFYYSRADYVKAREYFERAIEIDPEREESYRTLGDLFEFCGDIQRASEVYEKYLFSKGDSRANLLYAEFLQRIGKVQDSLVYIQKAQELNPDDSEVMYCFAKAFIGLERYTEAEDILVSLLKTDIDKKKAYSLLANIARDQGSLAKTEKYYWNLIQIDPENPLLRVELADFYQYTAQHDKASLAWKEILRQYPDHDTSLNYRRLELMVKAKGIQLVCVQYPLQNHEKLKEYFIDPENIIFVSNEDTFKKAVDNEGYYEYFTDKFAGKFGHCTDKGNVLIARNIYTAIEDHIGEYLEKTE